MNLKKFKTPQQIQSVYFWLKSLILSNGIQSNNILTSFATEPQIYICFPSDISTTSSFSVRVFYLDILMLSVAQTNNLAREYTRWFKSPTPTSSPPKWRELELIKVNMAR